MTRWLAALLAAAALGACTSDDDRAAGPPRHDAAAVTVASFDFPESELLAEIYAQALEVAGVPVDRQLGLGPRELVEPALRQGLVDVVPEYAGSALDAAAPAAEVDRSDAGAVAGALAAAVEPWGVAVLTPSRASNQNAVAVTAALAAAHRLDTVGDLVAVPAALVVGGPPECPQRTRCLPGLADLYGIDVDRFVALDDAAQVRRALLDGVVDVGIVFSTDAVLADDALVVLADDRGLQPAENVVPLVRRDALDADVRAVLDRVSAQLTTTSLRFLNWRLANAGADVAAEARGWLVRHGLRAR